MEKEKRKSLKAELKTIKAKERKKRNTIIKATIATVLVVVVGGFVIAGNK